MTSTPNSKKRFEVLMNPDMYDGMEQVAARHGLTPSSWVRFLVAQELTATLGADWIKIGDQETAS